MKHDKVILLSAAMALAGAASAIAQAQSTTPPPKVLVVTREFVKPGKTGMPHQKTESAFVQAMARAKWPTHYFAMTSLSGESRALFLVGYDSFDAWEKDNAATQKNTAFAAMLDRQHQGGIFPNGSGFNAGVTNKPNSGPSISDWAGNPTEYEGFIPRDYAFLSAVFLRDARFREKLYSDLKAGAGGDSR